MPTTSNRKSAKSPNFGLVVALAVIFLLLALVAAYLLLSDNGRRLIPHRQSLHPNARLMLHLPGETAPAA